ncbi:MAG: CCA tRNA nucleotidyltransferase [Henriciella sp.]|nr:CCA tRNA nucleotidyltransferase [Henriciella sp.]
MKRLETDWMTTPQTLAVIAALEAARPGGVRFVGGCVRNCVMGRAVDDIDIATQLEPAQTVAALKAAGLRAIPTGIEHGTVTAIVDRVPFEITSLRRDVETDGRRAVVTFTQDWAEDAQRRDFRMNALYAAPDGEVFDPVGGGYEDALAGRVIFIGDADQRLREDYLRILRFFRFNAWYGAEIDQDGLAACARQAAGLSRIARERVWKELKKMLAAPEPVQAMEAMANSGVLATIMPGAKFAKRFAELVAREKTARLEPDPIRRLMALMDRDLQIAENISKALRLSNAEADRLGAWASPRLGDPSEQGAQRLRAMLYWFGTQTVHDRAMLAGGELDAILPVIDGWERPSIPLDGGDAMSVGLKGEAIGEALRRIERYWVERDFVPNREELLGLLV